MSVGVVVKGAKAELRVGAEHADEVLRGRIVFRGETVQYADLIHPDDLVAADFDRKSVTTGGGLYLVEALENEKVVWRGCRRMQLVPAGIAVDQDGYGDWTTVASLDSIKWRVAGYVEDVYRKL